MAQPQDRVRQGDPFRQLDLAIAGEPPVIDRRPETTDDPDVVFEFLQMRLPFARKYASDANELLMFDEWQCSECSHNEFARVRASGAYQFCCVQCTTLVPRAKATAALAQASQFARNALDSNFPSQDKRNGIKVFRLDDVCNPEQMAAISSSDEGSTSRIKMTLKKLIKIGTIRPLSRPSNAWAGQLDEMREHFPNFRTFIDDVLEPSLSISAADGQSRQAPTLFVGAPGIGKSYFSSKLAEVLKTPMFRQDMSAASTGAALCGLSVHWANAGPGEVFKALAWGAGGVSATANPIAFLDEIDKVAGGQRMDPLAPMYQLLEVESARHFEDHSLPGLSIDASHVRWLMCANDLDPIPKPLLSRMHIVHVQAPTTAETRHMFGRIFASVVRETLLEDFEPEISKTIIDAAVERFSAREFKTRSTMAIGRALMRGRTYVDGCDFGTAPAPAVRKMGF